MKKIYLAIIVLISVINVHAQCMLYPVSLSTRVNNSSNIIEGKVISRKSFWNASHDYIYTSNLVSITQVIKGSINASFIEIITSGGEIGLSKLTVEPSLQLSVNEQGIFMMNSHEGTSQFGYQVFQTYTDEQGFIKFLEDGSAKEPFKLYSSSNLELKSSLESLLLSQISAFNSNQPSNKTIGGNQIMQMPVTSFAPASITAGTASQLTITGSGFGATQGANFVQFKNADDGGFTNITPHATQYLSWSNTQIVVEVPSKTTNTAGIQSGQAGTGTFTVNIGGTPNASAQPLTVSYGHLNVFFTTTVTPTRIFRTRHHGTNGLGGMTWRMHPTFDANIPAKNDFQTAFTTWRCATFINWQIGPTAPTTTVAGDGINIIGFDNVVIPPGGALPGGVLATCYSWFQGCTIGANVYWYVSELDIVFDDAANWQYGGGPLTPTQYDFESVTLHELGHGHQLSHVIDVPGVMHYSIAGGQIKNTLNGNDLAGGNAIMATNTLAAVCGNPIMIALNGTNCALAAPIASFNVVSPVCVGQVVPLNDVSQNNPNVWAWNMPTGAPASSTLQNTSTTYATPGVKSITLVATNGTGSTSITRTLNVIANPTLTVSSGTICSGNSTTLTATGSGTSYVWNPGALTGTSQVLSPGATQIYTVVGSLGACTGSAVGTITVSATPTISVLNQTICTGTSATMTANGATTYTWNPGALTGSAQTFSPGATQVYTINGVLGNCSSVKMATLTVTNTLNVGVAASTTFICVGETTTLTANGATNYTYNPGGIVTNPANVSPTITTNYTVAGQTGGCAGSAVITVSVDLCTNLANTNSDKKIIVYPNPTQGMITINFGGIYNGKISVYNSLGQIVLSKNIFASESLQINLSEFAKGIYTVKMSSEKNVTAYIKVVRD